MSAFLPMRSLGKVISVIVVSLKTYRWTSSNVTLPDKVIFASLATVGGVVQKR